MSRAVLLLLVLMLASCGDGSAGRDAFTQSRLPPGLSSRFWPPAGWTWGLIKPPGRPDLRYGVAAPVGVSRGDVVILPGYGETAEAWFETASNLIAAGYTVWIMDGAGQGGSGRFIGVRDLGHAPDFDSDILGLQALIKLAIRPAIGQRPAVLASGSAALPALAAAERGLSPYVLILSGPAEHGVKANGLTSRLARLGLSTLRAGGEEAWKRPDANPPQSPRVKAAQAWAIANPDLRMGGRSWGWVEARRKLANQALDETALAMAAARIVVISPKAGALPCARLPQCSEQLIPAGQPYPFEDDGVRRQWLAAVLKALPADHGT